MGWEFQRRLWIGYPTLLPNGQMYAGSDHSLAAEVLATDLEGCRFYMFAFPTKCTKFSLCGSPRAGVGDYVNVTWSTDENCVEPVGHMLVTCCFVFLCAHCVHLVKLCIRTASLRVHVRPCFHSCSSRVDTLYTLAPPSLLTCVWAAMKTFLPPHSRSVWCTLYTKEAT